MLTRLANNERRGPTGHRAIGQKKWIRRVIASTYINLTLRFRWVAIILCLLVAGGASFGAKNLVFSTDYRIFFSDQNPQLRALDRMEKTYAAADNVLFLVRPDDGTVFTPSHLQTLAHITELAWQLPFSTRVDSLTNYQSSRGVDDDLIVESLVVDAETLTNADAAHVAELALNDPQIAGRLVTMDGTASVVAVTFNLPEGDADAVMTTASAALAMAKAMQTLYPGFTVDVTGVVMMNREFATAAKADQMTIYPLMGLFLFLTMVWVLRSFKAASAAVVVVLLSSATAMGLAGWAGIKLTSPSAAASVLVLIIAIADSIHILVSTAALMRDGYGRTDAIKEAVKINMKPVFLTSITTAIGFFSLNWSDAPPFQHFGNIAAAGTIAAWMYSMLLLPALMSFVPARELSRTRQVNTAASALVLWVFRRRKAVLGVTFVAFIISLGALTQLRIDDNFIRYFSTSTTFRQSADTMQDYLPGLMSIDYSVSSGEEGGISDPAYLAKLQEFTNWLRTQPEVGHVNSLVEVMKRLNRNMHGDDPAFDKLPEERDLAAQYLLLYELSLPYGLDLNNQINVNKSASRVTAALHDVSTAEIKALKGRSEAWLQQNFPQSGVVEGTGISVIFTYLTIRNIESMLTGTAIAFVLISLCLIVALRSVRLGLLSLAINVLPVIMGFGAWAILHGTLGIYASFVAAAALGLIVDCTVHFLSKYLHARRQLGQGPHDAIQYAYSMVGAALCWSTLILLVGFTALMLSDFMPNAYFGLMAALVIAIALIADFLVLPVLILWADKEEVADANVRPVTA